MGRKTEKVLKPEEVLSHIQRKEVIVKPKGWPGGVKVSPPTLEALTALRMQYPDEEEFNRKSLFLFLADFTQEQAEKLFDGDGIKMATLMEAIAEVIENPLLKVGK